MKPGWSQVKEKAWTVAEFTEEPPPWLVWRGRLAFYGTRTDADQHGINRGRKSSFQAKAFWEGLSPLELIEGASVRWGLHEWAARQLKRGRALKEWPNLGTRNSPCAR